MNGDFSPIAQQRRQHNAGYANNAARASHGEVKIDRKRWAHIEGNGIIDSQITYMWHPRMGIWCPFCEKAFIPASEHFTTCRPCNGVELLQRKMDQMVNNRIVVHDRVHLNIVAVQEMIQNGLDLELLFKQENSWMPNEPIFNNIGNRFVNTNVTPLTLYDNLPNDFKMAPVAQDITPVNNLLSPAHGEIWEIYSPANITARQGRLRNVAAADMQVIDDLTRENADLSRDIAMYRQQIANVKKILVQFGNMNDSIPHPATMRMTDVNALFGICLVPIGSPLHVDETGEPLLNMSQPSPPIVIPPPSPIRTAGVGRRVQLSQLLNSLG